MADPFFQQAQQAQQGQQVPQVVVQQQIQALLQQQQLLQQQYNQLAALLQNPQTPVQQRAALQAQAQQISAQYQQHNQTLTQLGYNPNHVNKPTAVQTKPVSKLSFKGFLIGCGVFLIVLVGGLAAMFYYLMNNPNQLASVGLSPDTTKQLLQVFSVVFFGLLVFLGIALVVLNGYRLITVKNKSKIGYAMGMLLGLILFVGGIALGSSVLSAIKNLSGSAAVDTNKLVEPYISFKEGYTSLWSDASIKLIAPAVMGFKLNTDYFNGQVLPTLGQVQFQQMILDCGNGQTISMNMTTASFDGSCIYFAKGSYDLLLKVSYINTPTGEKMQKDIPVGSLPFASEIRIAPLEGKLGYNDAHTEMNLGKVPSKVSFDANGVFSDFGLTDYKITRDVDGTGQVDRQDVSSFTYVYKKAQLYYVTVRFPGLYPSDTQKKYGYVFPLRVEQSDVPVCEVLVKNQGGTNYSFTTSFLENTATISDYQFVFSDVLQKETLDTLKSSDGSVQYQFPFGGSYAVKMNFVTDEGKQGSCESEDILVGATSFDIRYDMSYKTPTMTTYQKIPSSGAVSLSNGVITLNELPTLLQISVAQIIPNDARATLKFLLDDKPVLPLRDRVFEIKVSDIQPHTLSLIVENPATQSKTEKLFTLGVKRDSIMGKLLIKPDTVGVDPFTVTLDASTTTLNDPEDEIVYFTWNFGDGEIKKNLSQGVIQHTYRYNASLEGGTYSPQVTITTKKGLTSTFGIPVPLIVKKPTMKLHLVSDSHPGQLVQMGDRVLLSAQINGVPSKMYWDFGNGKTLECSARECIQSATSYDAPGTYTIKVRVTYDDKPEIEGSLVMKVK